VSPSWHSDTGLLDDRDVAASKSRQRVAPGFRHDLVAYPGIQRPGNGRVEQRPGVDVPQPFDHQLGLPGQFGARLAGGEHQRDRISGKPARDEPQSLLGGLVQPLHVVDHADQRLVAGHLREQAEQRQPDEEPSAP
jgi:hypothetical protein